MTKQEIKDAKKARKAEKKRDKKQYGKGEAGRRAKMEAIAKEAAKKKAARAAERAISSVESTEGAPMKKYGASANIKSKAKNVASKAKQGVGQAARKAKSKVEETAMKIKNKKQSARQKAGSSMVGEKYDAKEAYNKNLSPKARLHYLENERHDKTGGHAIHKHMRNFGASMKNHNMGAAMNGRPPLKSAMNGTPPGSRMQNLAKKTMKSRPTQYHTSGMPDFITSRESGKRMNTMNIDEGNFSKITTKIPERSKVTAMYGSDKYQKGEEFYIDPKSQYKMKRTAKPLKKKK